MSVPEKDLRDSLNRILFLIDNDPRTGRKGLYTEVSDLKEEIGQLRQVMTTFIAEYRQAQAVKAAKTGLISAIVSGVVAAIVYLIKWLS